MNSTRRSSGALGMSWTIARAAGIDNLIELARIRAALDRRGA